MPVQKCTEKSSCIATPPKKKKKTSAFSMGHFCFFASS